MYQLLIQTNNQWHNLDVGNATIALTYEANDIAELKSREVNRSNRIKLPRTPANDLLLGVPAEPLSTANSPYRYFDCRLYHSGVELFGPGSKLQLLASTPHTHEVCLKGSLFDFFEAIKDLPLRQLNKALPTATTPLEPHTVAWNVNTVANSSLSKDVLFPLVDWDDADNGNLTYSQPGVKPDEDLSDTRVQVKAKYLYPCLKLSWLAEEICRQQKYTLHLPPEVLNDNRYTQAVVPVTSVTPSQADLNALRDSLKLLSNRGQECTNERDNRHYTFTPAERFVFTQPAPSRCQYIPTNSGTYTFSLVVDASIVAYTGEVHLEHHYGMDEEKAQLTALPLQPYPPFINRYQLTYAVKLKAGVPFWFNLQVRGSGGGKITISNLSFRCTNIKHDGSAIFPATAFPVVAGLPDMTQLDLIKAIAQLWGLTLTVNEREKRIEAYTFQRLIDNMLSGDNKRTRDWSDKLDDKEHRTSYQWNSYGQKNLILYKDDDAGENQPKITNSGYFEISNETLPKEKKLFELPFAACEEIGNSGIRMAKIRMVKNGDTSKEAIKEPKAKILFVEQRNVAVKFAGLDDKLVGKEIPKNTAVIATFDRLKAQSFIEDYYNPLCTRLLHNARVVVEKMWLTPIDINEFDHAIPIYLNKYGCHFYVNKINNYIAGKLTEVELVTIRPPKIN